MNKKTIRFIAAYLVIAAGCFCVYFTPQAKYEGKEVVLSVMEDVPENFGRWRGKNMSMKIDDENPVYNFLSKAFARFYEDRYLPQKGLFFMMVDAGNFHHPRVCMQAGGVRTESLAPRAINVGGREILVQLVLTEGKDSGSLIVYWICIDKKVLRRWIDQKAHQFIYSLFNKKSVGLMVRADIACSRDSIDEGVKYAEKFFSDMYRNFPEESREYLFGGSN